MSVAAVERIAAIQAMAARLQGGNAAPGFGAALAPPPGQPAPPPAAAAAGMAPTATAALSGPAALASPQAPSAPGAGGGPFAAEIAQAAGRHGISPQLLTALVRQESNFNPAARSPAGAQGLTQLMPATARSLGVDNPLDPQQALDGGAKYLRQMLDRFDGNTKLALAAYNAGPGAVERFGGVPPYPETQRYVATILGRLGPQT